MSHSQNSIVEGYGKYVWFTYFVSHHVLKNDNAPQVQKICRHRI